MDHEYVEQHHIFDSYAMGSLPADERTRFEEHFRDCRQCLDNLKQVVLTAGESRLSAKSASAWPPGWKLWQYAAVLGIASLLLLLTPCAFFLRETSRVHRELEIARITSAEWQRKYGEQQKELEILKQEHHELEAKITQVMDALNAMGRRSGTLDHERAKAPVSSAEAPTPPTRMPSEGLFAVQVGAFKNRGNADRVLADFEKQFGTTRLALQNGNPPLWRVLVGDESTIEGAKSLAARIRAGKAPAFVVKLNQ